MSDQTQLGKIVNSHGLDGTVKLYPYTDCLDQFQEGMTLEIGNPSQSYQVKKVRQQKGMVYLKLEGIETRTEADGLKEAPVYVLKENRRDLQANEYFIEDLLGFSVYEEDGNFLGSLQEVEKGLANDLYIVKGEDKVYWIPGVKEFILKIDLEEKKIVVHLIEGMAL